MDTNIIGELRNATEKGLAFLKDSAGRRVVDESTGENIPFLRSQQEEIQTYLLLHIADQLETMNSLLTSINNELRVRGPGNSL